MNRLKRFLRSRFFIGAFCILLEFAQLLGAFIFMLLSSNSTGKKEYAHSKKVLNEIQRFQQQTTVIDKLHEHDEGAWLQANYLYHIAGMPCFENSKVTYYPLGENFHVVLLEELKKAESFIFMEYFIVQDGKMWYAIHDILKEKAAGGVSVYFIYDDFGCMATLPEHYNKQLCSEGIHCVIANKFTPVLSHIHNNRDHRKITVIDGKVGFTGGVNLADEYINAVVKHGHWKDTAIKIEGEAVRNLSALFLTNWNTQSKEGIDYAVYMRAGGAPVDRKEIVIPFGDDPAPTYKDTIGKNVYLNTISAAKRYLYIMAPYLICDHEILNALRITAEKGVDVSCPVYRRYEIRFFENHFFGWEYNSRQSKTARMAGLFGRDYEGVFSFALNEIS